MKGYFYFQGGKQLVFFKVEVQEVLARIYAVEVDTLEAALQHVNDLYDRVEICLDANDFVGVEFKVYEG